MSEAARHMKEIGIFLDCLFDFGGGLDVYWIFQPFEIHLWVLCSLLPLEKSTCHQHNAFFFSWANVSTLNILCMCMCKSALTIQQGTRTEMVLVLIVFRVYQVRLTCFFLRLCLSKTIAGFVHMAVVSLSAEFCRESIFLLYYCCYMIQFG